jgi:putative FmdB family regulatory protein
VPLYEYQCPKCGRFEVIRKFADEPLTACPTCGSEIQKLASAPAFHLKGTGWYVTDYAKKSSGDGQSGPGTSDEGKSGESKSGETKPAESKSSEAKSGPGKSDSRSGDSGKGKGKSADGSKSSKDASTATPAFTPKGGSTSGSGSST